MLPSEHHAQRSLEAVLAMGRVLTTTAAYEQVVAGMVATDEADLVDAFLADYDDIRRTRIATNVRLRGTRFAIATTVCNQSGEAVASITLVGPTGDVQPRAEKLAKLLTQHVDSWSHRLMTPREAI